MISNNKKSQYLWYVVEAYAMFSTIYHVYIFFSPFKCYRRRNKYVQKVVESIKLRKTINIEVVKLRFVR